MSKLKEHLHKAGWFENRNIAEKISHLPLIGILPKSLQQLFFEFGGLTIQSIFSNGELSQKIQFPDASFYNNPVLIEYYSNKLYTPDKQIDLTLGEDDPHYYFSVILGRSLFAVANLDEQGVMLVDEQLNVYEHNFLGDFLWVGKNIEQGLENLLFRSGEMYILDEVKLTWKPLLDNVDYPPCNPKLNGVNPW
jgi:hypothetical protein